MLVRLALFILLVACTPSDRLQRTYGETNGVWQTVSRDTEVFRDDTDHVLARTIILESGSETRYFLSLSFLHGKGNRPRILSVEMNEQPLPYMLHDRLRTFCIDHCHAAEIGQIRLTAAQFRTAANGGMILSVTGKHRDHAPNVPARLFYSALQAANLLEPVRNPLP